MHQQTENYIELSKTHREAQRKVTPVKVLIFINSMFGFWLKITHIFSKTRFSSDSSIVEKPAESITESRAKSHTENIVKNYCEYC